MWHVHEKATKEASSKYRETRSKASSVKLKRGASVVFAAPSELLLLSVLLNCEVISSNELYNAIVEWRSTLPYIVDSRLRGC